jgi:cell division protein FtsL
MQEFEYCSLFKQLHEERKLIFDDVIHRNQLYLNILICLFLIGGDIISKTFKSRIIMII